MCKDVGTGVGFVQEARVCLSRRAVAATAKLLTEESASKFDEKEGRRRLFGRQAAFLG